MSTITTVNPATGEMLATYTPMTADQINAALDAATVSQRHWSAESFEYRAAILRSAAEDLRSRAKSLALLVTREMGKPITESEAEVEKCAVGLEYYADHAQSFLADERFDTDADHSWVSYEPAGVVLAIMPWNFPLWQVFRFAAPALMAGNAALLKHSSNTTGTAINNKFITTIEIQSGGCVTAGDHKTGCSCHRTNRDISHNRTRRRAKGQWEGLTGTCISTL